MSADNHVRNLVDTEVLTMTIQCCKCKKIRADGKWISLGRTLHDGVSHSYCPACLDRAIAEIRDEQRKYGSLCMGRAHGEFAGGTVGA